MWYFRRRCDASATDRLRFSSLAGSVRGSVGRPEQEPSKGGRGGAKSDRLVREDEGGARQTNPGGAEIPDGSTVMEIATMPPEEAAKLKAEEAAKAAKLKNEGDTSHAAKAILEKFMRRPRS